MRLVGIDLGGTAIKAGSVSETGDILARRSTSSGTEKGASEVLDRIAALALELGPLRAVGLGAPGLFDRARGVALDVPNLRCLEGVPLRAELARRLALPEDAVLLENDANAAAFGESWIGAGRDEKNLLVVTLGTGVGGGLVLDGEIFSGPGGMAGEIGHVVVDPKGPLCGCGAHGCLETLASASAASARAKALRLPREEPGDLVRLADHARSPGPERELLHAIGLDLGRGLATAVALLDLRLFVVGGGFGAALHALEPGIREGLRERCYGKRIDSVRILPAALGADAGWIGAARRTLSFSTR